MSLFSVTSTPKKRRAEQGLDKYEAAKRRQKEKDRVEAADTLMTLASEKDDVYPCNTKKTVATQSDLTVVDLSALEEDHQRRSADIAGMRTVAKRYPSQEDLKSSEEVLCFYTGCSSFMVLRALFKLVSVDIPEG